MQALTQGQITKKITIIWENPYSKISEWQEKQLQREEERCQERMLMHASWDLEEKEEEEFLQKVEKGEMTQLTAKEVKLLKDIEGGNTNGGQVGNYGLCIEKATEAWRRKIVIKDGFFMPFATEVEKCEKDEENKIYIVMYHEHVDYEYSHSSIEAVFNTELEARHWIAAKIKREQKKKRQTREFVKKGGDTRNLPYDKEYRKSIWEDIWYTVEEKTIS